MLGGGGARCAYQAGVLRALSRRLPQLQLPILTGTSAGAVNIGFLANHTALLRDGAEALANIWSRLSLPDIFSATPLSLLKQMFRTAAQLTVGVGSRGEVVKGLVDTRPMRQFLQREFGTTDGSLPGIATNLRTGRLQAAAITATRYPSGESVTFCAGRQVRTWNRPQRIAVATELTLDHVMASAALPILYPAVRLADGWYGDGEIGLIAPLAPALHLGAGRILAISAWGTRSDGHGDASAGHPVPSDVLSVLYAAAFADRLDHDAAGLERMNRLLRGRPPSHRLGHRQVDLLVLRPSVDLGATIGERGVEIPKSLRLLARTLDLQRSRSRDLLSVVMLDRTFLDRMLAIGERDGERRAEEVSAFLARGPHAH